MATYWWIALGGALGSVARHACAEWAARLPVNFPVGTLLVNVLGSFVIGLLAGLGIAESRWQLPLLARQFLMVGVLGGYTTFSSFSLQTVLLAREGAWLLASLNVVASVVLCLLACAAGFAVMGALNR